MFFEIPENFFTHFILARKKAPPHKMDGALTIYTFYCLLSVGKNSIAGFPAFKLAVAPGSINAKGDSCQDHDEQPLEEETQTSAVKTQPSAFYISVRTDPALLRRIGPREEKPNGEQRDNSRPDQQP